MGNRRILLRKPIALTLSSLLWPGAVVQEQDSAAAQQYSRQGCPTGLRAELWALILNSTNQPQVRRALAHTRSQGRTAVEADTVCYEADAAAAFPNTACLLPDVPLAALFISKGARSPQQLLSFSSVIVLQLAALLSTCSNAWRASVSS